MTQVKRENTLTVAHLKSAIENGLASGAINLDDPIAFNLGDSETLHGICAFERHSTEHEPTVFVVYGSTRYGNTVASQRGQVVSEIFPEDTKQLFPEGSTEVPMLRR